MSRRTRDPGPASRSRRAAGASRSGHLTVARCTTGPSEHGTSLVRPADGRDGQALEIGPPRVLFDGPYFQCSEWGRSYDLAPDGSRFLMVHDQRPELAATQINVVVNWFAELAAL
jgi:hypothetical protein